MVDAFSYKRSQASPLEVGIENYYFYHFQYYVLEEGETNFGKGVMVSYRDSLHLEAATRQTRSRF